MPDNNLKTDTWNGLADQKGLSPVLLAFASLPVIFIVYQGAGAALLFLLQGGNPLGSVTGTRLVQGLSQFLFLALPVTGLILLHTKRLSAYTFLNGKLSVSAIGLVVLSVLSVQPVIQWIGSIERLIPWPPVMVALREQMESMLKALVTADSIPELGFVLLVVAITPAFVEEFYFRGYLLRNFSRRFHWPVAVVLSGTLFGLFHFNPFQITGLLLLGIYFSFLVWYFQSLWAGIIAHFVNNGLAVVVLYLANHLMLDIPLDDPDYQVPGAAVVFSALLFGLSVWMLIRLRLTNK